MDFKIKSIMILKRGIGYFLKSLDFESYFEKWSFLEDFKIILLTYNVDEELITKLWSELKKQEQSEGEG